MAIERRYIFLRTPIPISRKVLEPGKEITIIDKRFEVNEGEGYITMGERRYRHTLVIVTPEKVQFVFDKALPLAPDQGDTLEGEDINTMPPLATRIPGIAILLRYKKD